MAKSPEMYYSVFSAVRDGSLLNKVSTFSDEEIRPFLPLLMYGTFADTGFAGQPDLTTKLDALRARLIEIPSGNDILTLLRQDVDKLQHRFNEIRKGHEQVKLLPSNFALMTMEEKITLIGSHLITKSQTALQSFEPFDAESFQEEVTWIISFLGYMIPTLYNISELAPDLLAYSFGKQILFGVVLNHPVRLEQTLRTLLSTKTCDEGPGLRRKNDAIFALIKLDPALAEEFLNQTLLVPNKYRLAVNLLCSKLIHDQIFVNMLICCLMQPNNQFATFLIKHANKEMAEKIRKRFNEVLQLRKHPESRERLVLLLCVLANCNILKAANSGDGNNQWIRFLTDTSVRHVRLLKMMMATILACPNLLPQNMYADGADYHLIGDFFAYARELTKTDETQTYASLNQFMLLVAIHFKSDNHVELSKLLSSELSRNVGDVLRKQVNVRSIFLQKAMLEEDVAQGATLLGVTKNLDDKVAGYLPVHCINQLLSARIFSRNQIKIHDWVKNQLLECRLPVHSVMVQMLENFALSCFPTNEDQNCNMKLDEEFFWDVYKTDLFADDQSLATKSLCLLYLLAFTRRLDTTPLPHLKDRKQCQSYSDALWAEIPIRCILSTMDARPRDFECIRPNLLHLVGLCMPHMLPTLDAILDKTEDELSAKASSQITTRVPIERFSQSLDHIRDDPTTFARLVRILRSSSIREQYRHYATVVKAVTVSLDADLCPLSVARQVAKIWKRLENLIPRKLYEQTLQLWLNTPRSAAKTHTQVTNALLLKEMPLIMFRVDDRVFRSPPHFELLMRMLTFYMDAAKNYTMVRLTRAAATSETRAEIEERHQLFKGYTGTQHLAVVQVLLETCDGDIGKEPGLSEIRDIACAQIHQMFVSDPALPKLVHFNMYPSRLISMVVQKVPSVHVLLAELHELVHQSHLQRRIFTINLIAELAEKYKIPMALAGLEFISDVLHVLLNTAVDEATILLFYNVTSALSKFIKLSPFHAETVRCMLDRVRSIARARASLYRTKRALDSSPELALIKAIDAALDEQVGNKP